MIASTDEQPPRQKNDSRSEQLDVNQMIDDMSFDLNLHVALEVTSSKETAATGENLKHSKSLKDPNLVIRSQLKVRS